MRILEKYELSKKERLFLLNQLEILGILYENDESETSHSVLYGKDHVEKLKDIVMSGYEYDYHEVLGFLSDPFTYEDGEFVTDLFVLYNDIARVVINNKDEFTDDEIHKACFPGFDGNRDDGFYGYANYLAKNYAFPHLYKLLDLEDEEDRQYGVFNSHGMDSVYSYREMLKVYNEILSEYDGRRMDLTVKDVKSILEVAR